MTNDKGRRELRTAYDAFWFLDGHPKLMAKQAILATPDNIERRRAEGWKLRKVKDEMPWNKSTYLLQELNHLRRKALECNLDIHYAKVNDKRRVDDDSTKNKFVECWLEFGPIKYAVSDGELHLMHFHDVALDCGAPTFDEALLILAKKVLKEYGDYRDGYEDRCKGCPTCRQVRRKK